MKKAFTIIELLISIVIFSLIITFLYSTVDNLNLSNEFYKHKKAQFDEKEKLANLLFLDISKSKEVRVLNPLDRQYSSLILSGTQSIYGPSKANVLWFVNTDTNFLSRIETFDEIKNGGVFVGNAKVNINLTGTKCETFKVIKQQSGTILYLKFEGKEAESYFIN